VVLLCGVILRGSGCGPSSGGGASLCDRLGVGEAEVVGTAWDLGIGGDTVCLCAGYCMTLCNPVRGRTERKCASYFIKGWILFFLRLFPLIILRHPQKGFQEM